MKILLVSNAFYPEISPRSFRATELAIELARQGHKVVVYTKLRDFDYTVFLKEHPITFKMWSKDRFPRIPEFNGRFGRLVKRALNRILLMSFEYPAIEDMFKVKNLLGKEDGYELLVSFAVPFPVHWGVAWARKGKHRIATTWVADCGDPFMGNTNDSFKKFFYFSYLEKWFLHKADYVSIPKIEMKANYYPLFHWKFREIPQGFDFSIKDRLPEYIKNKIPTFAFAGSFIKEVRDPSSLLGFLVLCKFNFRFVIFTKNTEFLQPYKEKLGDKLDIREYLPREELLNILSGMDFLINIAFDPATQAPSKLIDYSLTGRPVLGLTSGKADTALIDKFLKGDYTDRMELGNIEKYNIQNIAKQFTNLLNE